MAMYQGIQYDFKFVTDPLTPAVKPPGDCEVEVICHAGHGIGGNGGGAFPYVCGFKVAGTTWGCPKRRRLVGRESHQGA